MSRPVALYCRSSRFTWLALLAGCGALVSAFLPQNLLLAIVTCTLFALPMVVLAFFALQPEVQVYDTHLAVGHRTFPWAELAKVDHLGWTIPLVVRLTSLQGKQRMVFYPGDQQDGSALLDHIRKMARNARLDGVPYDEFWAEHSGVGSEKDTALDVARLDAVDFKALISDPLNSSSAAVLNDEQVEDKQINGKQSAKEEAGKPDSPATSFHLLSPEDERDVELLYQRLKSVGHIDAIESESRDPQE